jgi:hypothetical protein
MATAINPMAIKQKKKGKNNFSWKILSLLKRFLPGAWLVPHMKNHNIIKQLLRLVLVFCLELDYTYFQLTT